MCQEQATKIAKKWGITGFVCSRSWAAGFKARNGIVSTTLYGEMASADHEAAKKYPQQFRDMVTSLGIANSNVYNADESLFYPRLQSRKTLCPERLAKILRGGKADRLRIGMLVTTCADGSNDCPLLFSHTARQPHGMKEWQRGCRRSPQEQRRDAPLLHDREWVDIQDRDCPLPHAHSAGPYPLEGTAPAN
jgi:hypothetical protein